MLRLIRVTGRLGGGKTAIASIIGKHYSEILNLPLYTAPAEFHIQGEAQNITTYEQLNNLENAVLVFDELWRTADSREWRKNFDIISFFMELRKREVYCIFTSQLLGQSDLRIRGIVELDIIAQQKRNKFHYYTFIDSYSGQILKTYIIEDLSKYYDLFNSKSKIRQLI